MNIKLTDEERESTEAMIKSSWGNKPHGFTEHMPDGTMKVITFVPILGRRFIKGRAVYHMPNETRLSDDYFLPAGRYGGYILR